MKNLKVGMRVEFVVDEDTGETETGVVAGNFSEALGPEWWAVAAESGEALLHQDLVLREIFGLVTMEESVGLQADADAGMLTAESLYWKQEADAERYAETAWLRHAESLGWQEAYMEEMYEAGLLSPWCR